MAIMGTMYLRHTTKKKGETGYDYWLWVESVRTALGPRQRVVATIGKLPGLDREERVGWEEVGRILSGKPHPTPGLFEQREEPPSWATVNINGVSEGGVAHKFFIAESINPNCIFRHKGHETGG